MRIAILAVGRMRAGPEADLCDDYLSRAARLAPGLGFSGPDAAEIDPSRKPDARTRKAEEAQALLARTNAEQLIALDEGGRDLSSENLAALLARYRDDGAREVAFAIGGADGHGADIAKRADAAIAFGKATWPHMLVRAMLAEQIYRAMTICAGHPYHRS